MKKSLFSSFILISLLTVGCSNTSTSNNSVSNDSSSKSEKVSSSSYKDDNKTYKITFKDNEKIIYEAEGKSGEFVDIPDDPVSDDPQKVFKGCEGIDEYDLALGKVEIFEEDAVYYAIWGEKFGTDNVFSATKLYSNSEILLDGKKDEAYNA